MLFSPVKGALDFSLFPEPVRISKLACGCDWFEQAAMCLVGRPSQFRSSSACLLVVLVNCLGHAGVKGNDRADRLAGKATTTGGLRFGRSEVLRSLRHYLAGTKPPRTSHHRSPGGERRRQRGSAQRSSLRGGERAIVNETNIGTVSRGNIGETPERRGGAERISVWAHCQFSSLYLARQF